MLNIYRYELKNQLKSLLLWVLIIAGMGFACIVMYNSLQDSLAESLENFGDMGAFSSAFGMDTISIATMKGYFATEIGFMHGLGSAMFAAILTTTILSREEDGHTGEFIYTMPLSRGKIMTMKLLAAFTSMLAFNLLSGLVYRLGFIITDNQIPMDEFLKYMGLIVVMNIEILALCFFISSVSRQNRIGIGFGLAMLLYVYDMIARIIPDLEDYIFLTPFSFSNASSVLAGEDIETVGLILGIIITLASVTASYIIYTRRDLAS